MIIDRKDHGVVRFRLEPSEWSVGNGRAVRKFLHDLREAIPLERREFDQETCAYTVWAGDFDGKVERLRERYFQGEVIV